MADFMLAHPNVLTGISYHSYGDLILYPYGYTYEDLPPDMNPIDRQTFVAMGAEMERTTGYHAAAVVDLYITDGDWNDWMYGALHRYPITIELSGGTLLPARRDDPVRDRSESRRRRSSSPRWRTARLARVREPPRDRSSAPIPRRGSRDLGVSTSLVGPTT